MISTVTLTRNDGSGGPGGVVQEGGGGLPRGEDH